MKKPTVLSLLGVLLFSFTAVAQDDDAPEHVEKRQIVIVEEHDDGDGPVQRQVIVLDGEGLDGMDLDLDLDVDIDVDEMKGVHKKLGKLRMRDGDETMEFDFDLSDEAHGDNPFKGMKSRLKGIKGLDGLEMEQLFDPAKRGEFIKAMKARALESRKKAREAKAKKARDGAIAALELNDEVAAVLVPMLDAVLETQARIEQDDLGRRKALRKAPQDEAALRPQLEALRAASKKDAQDLGAAREKLRQLLTLEQEVELVLRGILD